MDKQTVNRQFSYAQTTHKVFGFFSSLFFHTSILLLVFFYYCVLLNQPIVLEHNEQIITVDLVAPPDSIINESVTIKNLSTNLPPPNLIDDDSNKTLSKLEETERYKFNTFKNNQPLQSTSELFEPSQAQARYGIIFASHIKRFAHKIPDKVNFQRRVEIMLKIDKEGNLKEYKILNTKNKAIEQVVGKILRAASPFPPPPLEAFSSDYILYKFYLSFN